MQRRTPTTILSIALILSLATVPAAAPIPSYADTTPSAKELAAKILALAERDNQVMAHLDHLSNVIGPRLTGSDGINEAYAWTQAQFESWGLEARLEKWGEYPIGFNRGPWSGKVISKTSGEKPLVFGTQSWTAGTDGPVRGPALLEPGSEAEIAKLGDTLEGAWIISQGSSRSRRAERRKLQDALWKAGIAGLVRSVRGELIVTSGSTRGITPDNLPTRVVANVIASQFKEIVSQLEAGEKVELELDIKNEFKPQPYTHYNVIADLRGSEFPDEYVIVGGHIDTWDGATGAIDNGTGVATTLEAARLLAKSGIKPRRTIRFMLWSGEEQGLLGSRAHVQANPELMPKISAVLVHDGGTNVLSGIVATKAMMPQIQAAFSPLVDDGHELPFKIKEVGGLRGGGSDHNSFLAAGVPGFFWNQSGRANYTFTHHTQHDHFDQAIPEYQKRSATVVALGALGIANLDALLDRTGMTAPQRPRKLLGVQVDGVTVTSVTSDSRAEKAGIKPGDRILKADGKAIEGLDDLRGVIQAASGSTPFVVEREGKQLTLTAEFPEEKKPEALKKPKPSRRYY